MRSPRETARTTPQQKLEQILDAAGTLFSQQGFAQTAVEQIAHRAGVSKGLIYVHFPSKEALLEAVLESALTRWFEVSIRAAAVGRQTVAEMIGSSLRASIDHARRDSVLRGLLAQDPRVLLGGNKQGPDPAALVHTRALRGLILHGIREGELRKDLDPASAANALSLMHYALVRELFTSKRLERAPEGDDLVETTIDMMLSGMRVRPTPDTHES